MFNLSPSKNQVKSMAGMIQAATLVTQLARADSFDRTAMHAATYSLIKLDSDSIDELYGGPYGIDLGLRTMARLFAVRPDNEAREIYQYAAGTHQLAMKLGKLQKTAGIIHSELAVLGERFAEYEQLDSEEQDLTLQTELADLYSRTVSFMSPRIIVQGSSGRLQEPETVSRVRTALFSGIRAAFMWHQFGGRRLHLLFSRGRYAALARSMVNK